jgi:hypothetical protein
MATKHGLDVCKIASSCRSPSGSARLLLFGLTLVLGGIVEEGQARRDVAHVLAKEARSGVLICWRSVDLMASCLGGGPGDGMILAVRCHGGGASALGKVCVESRTGPAAASFGGRRA